MPPKYEPDSGTTHHSPDLCFGEHFNKLKDESIYPFTYLERSNIVHHTSVRVDKPAHFRQRTSVYRACAPIGIRTIDKLASINLELTKSRNTHYRVRTTDGKFLCFGTGNIILAGRKNHATSCMSSTKMVRLFAHELRRPVMAVSHQAPNSVITGKLAFDVDPAIKTDAFVGNCSPKFPGIALLLKNNIKPRCTPELYLRKGMVIMPGITTAAQLVEVIKEIGVLLEPYKIVPK